MLWWLVCVLASSVVCVSCYELAPLIYSAVVNSLFFPLAIAFIFCENNFTTIDLYNGLKVASPLRPRLRMICNACIYNNGWLSGYRTQEL